MMLCMCVVSASEYWDLMNRHGALNSIDATRLLLNLPSLDHRPPAPLPPLAPQRPPNRRQHQRHHRRVRQQHTSTDRSPLPEPPALRHSFTIPAKARS